MKLFLVFIFTLLMLKIDASRNISEYKKDDTPTSKNLTNSWPWGLEEWFNQKKHATKSQKGMVESQPENAHSETTHSILKKASSAPNMLETKKLEALTGEKVEKGQLGNFVIVHGYDRVTQKAVKYDPLMVTSDDEDDSEKDIATIDDDKDENQIKSIEQVDELQKQLSKKPEFYEQQRVANPQSTPLSILIHKDDSFGNLEDLEDDGEGEKSSSSFQSQSSTVSKFDLAIDITINDNWRMIKKVKSTEYPNPSSIAYEFSRVISSQSDLYRPLSSSDSSTVLMIDSSDRILLMPKGRYLHYSDASKAFKVATCDILEECEDHDATEFVTDWNLDAMHYNEESKTLYAIYKKGMLVVMFYLVNSFSDSFNQQHHSKSYFKYGGYYSGSEMITESMINTGLYTVVLMKNGPMQYLHRHDGFIVHKPIIDKKCNIQHPAHENILAGHKEENCCLWLVRKYQDQQTGEVSSEESDGAFSAKLSNTSLYTMNRKESTTVDVEDYKLVSIPFPYSLADMVTFKICNIGHVYTYAKSGGLFSKIPRKYFLWLDSDGNLYKTHFTTASKLFSDLKNDKIELVRNLKVQSVIKKAAIYPIVINSDNFFETFHIVVHCSDNHDIENVLEYKVTLKIENEYLNLEDGRAQKKKSSKDLLLSTSNHIIL